jgi:hypothetical protein
VKVQSQSHRINLVMWLNSQGVASTAIIKRDYVKVNRSAGAREGVQYTKCRICTKAGDIKTALPLIFGI